MKETKVSSHTPSFKRGKKLNQNTLSFKKRKNEAEKEQKSMVENC